MPELIKDCPFCAEEIHVDAKKCKHCGSTIEEGLSLAVTKNPSVADFGILLLAVPVVATMLIWLWVGEMNLLQSPGDVMMFLLAAVVLGTAIIAGLEASKAGGVSANAAEGTYSGTSWFLLIAMFWFFAYPAYLYKRKHYGLANLVFGGVLMAPVFVGSWVVMNSEIENRQADVRGNLEQLQKNLRLLGQPATDLAAVPANESDKGEQLELADNPFQSICAPIIVPRARKFGGMSAAEAMQHAKLVCAEVEPTYVKCVNSGTDQNTCLDDALPTSE